MPVVAQKREFPVAPDVVYDVISDPRKQAGWWPRVTRIEDVTGRPGAERARWTSVFQADSGRLLRLDYRCIAASRPSRYEWEQELEGTPFEKHLARQAVAVRIEPSATGSEVTLTADHTIRGMAKIAGFAMRKSQRQLLNTALDSLGELLGGTVPREGE